ncbi:MAG: hypothetical protein CMC59_01660 [Flavobacteriaceae bacterium]|nr:hypothetical protein [Flavobacteriaceae bacterium]
MLFQGHIFFLGFSKGNSNLIYKSYTFIYLFSISLFLLMYLKAKKNAQLASIFFIGSSIKLTVFFLIFRPILFQDNYIDKLEISSFLIPYIFSSVYIIYCISKLLVNPN